jgi:uncharacterized protein (DUF362 family)
MKLKTHHLSTTTLMGSKDINNYIISRTKKNTHEYKIHFNPSIEVTAKKIHKTT